MTKIVLPFNDLLNQKYTEKISHVIELHEQYFRWHCVFNAEERPRDNDGVIMNCMPMVEVYNYYDELVLKEAVKGVALTWLANTSLWQVRITLDGFPTEIYVYYQKKESAIELQQTIFNWRLS